MAALNPKRQCGVWSCGSGNWIRGILALALAVAVIHAQIPAIGSVAPTASGGGGGAGGGGVGSPAFVSGQIVQVQGGYSGSGSAVTGTFPNQSAAGNCIIAGAGTTTNYVGTPAVVTDNHSNSYALDASGVNSSDGNFSEIDHALVAATATLTLSAVSAPSGAAATLGIVGLEFSGLGCTKDQAPSSNVVTGSSNSGTCPSVTTTHANEVVACVIAIAYSSYPAITGLTPSSGFTAVAGSTGILGNDAIFMLYRVVSSAGTYSPSFTILASGTAPYYVASTASYY